MLDKKVDTWSRNELVEYVNTHAIDFVARCSTKWHLLAIEAFIRTVFEDGDVVKGIIYVCPHNGKYLLTKDAIKFPNFVELKIVYGEGISLKEKVKQTIRCLAYGYRTWIPANCLYVIAPESCWSFLICGLNRETYTPVSVIIEDGFAHYNSEKTWISENKKITQRIITSIQFKMIKIIRNNLRIKEIVFTLFDKEHEMKINETVVAGFKQCLKENHKRLYNNIYIKNEATVLFLSQPLVEDGHLTEERLNAFYAELTNRFSDRLIVKVHPRDIATKSSKIIKNYIVDDQGLSAEEMVLCLDKQPDYVLGFNSTSLVTLKLFYDFNTISLNHLIVDNVGSDYLIDSFENFEHLFGKIVTFVDSIDDIFHSC